MDLREVGCFGVGWIELAQDGDGNEPSGFIQCLELLSERATGGCSGRTSGYAEAYDTPVLGWAVASNGCRPQDVNLATQYDFTGRR
jgi:hypothetical protein